MNILGISAYYHDSAACLVKDGKVIFAVEEERFSRIKHDNNFPEKAIEKCLEIGQIKSDQIDCIAYYEKPLLKFERILETFIDTWPISWRPFIQGLPEWLGEKITVKEKIKKTLNYRGKILFVSHHLSHLAAAFYSSGFEKAAVVTVDGVGEWQTTGLWLVDGHKIKPLKAINFPHSLGLLYSTFTSFLGFKVNEDEYKVMGLAPYGKSKYENKIKQLIEVKPDGSFQLDLRYFSFREKFQMWSGQFEKLFGKPRKFDGPITQRDKDLAASIQKTTEEIYFKILRHLYQLTKIENVCLSGGVALNSLANGKIYENAPFKNVWVFGPAGDGGAALGAALFANFNVLKQISQRKKMTSLSLGSGYNNLEIEMALGQYKLKYKRFKNKEELIDKTARLLFHGEIIGWFQGRCEFGPRALGNRSILCRPWPREMKRKMNLIKKREQFRPFAGSILQEKVADYFYVPEKNYCSPFMTFCFQTKKKKETELAAIVHKDKTCRIQTVNGSNDLYYQLIKKFYQLTGTACILNTSFNLKGEPIIEHPVQAIEDFLKTKMNYLVINDYLVYHKAR